MLNGLQAYDTQTGRALTESEALDASDNPHIWTWVSWRPETN